MMNKKLKLGFIALLLIIIVVLVYFFASGKSKNEIVFIENNKIFEAFQMKKDYDRILEKELMVESQRLDSLGRSIQEMEKNQSGSTDAIEASKETYFAAKSTLEERFSTLSKEYTAQVYERLNMYIQEFGKMKNYRFVLGGNGQGNVMYVDKDADVTEEVLLYINQKYLDK